MPRFPGRTLWSCRRKQLVALAVLLWIAMPCLAGWMWGADELEDWFLQGAMPVGLAWNFCLLTAGILIWKRRYQFAALAVGLTFLIWLAGNPTLANRLFAGHEARAHSVKGDPFSQSFDAIVVLGGCSRRLPNGRVEVNAFGERIVAAARLWHARRTELILVTGGLSIDDDDAPCVKNEELLVSLGVPRDKIIRLPARNTHDEVQVLVSYIQGGSMANAGGVHSQGPRSLGLITNAFHMPRALRLAREQGLDATPLPAGHYSNVRPWKPSHLIPTAESVMLNSLLLKEALAWIVGR